jgi:hypothetical protein
MFRFDPQLVWTCVVLNGAAAASKISVALLLPLDVGDVPLFLSQGLAAA